MNLGSLVARDPFENINPAALSGVSVESFGPVSVAVLGGGTLAGLLVVYRLCDGLLSSGSTATENRTSEDSAIETLEERYVAGEIDDGEFERRLEILYENAARDDRERASQREVIADGAGDLTDGGAVREPDPVTAATEPSGRGTCGSVKRSSKRRRGSAPGHRGCR